MTFEQRWGYKGTETSINGLTKWMEDNYSFRGNAESKTNQMYRVIEHFGKENISDWKPHGHLKFKALFVAKWIRKNNAFNTFTNWFAQANKL